MGLAFLSDHSALPSKGPLKIETQIGPSKNLGQVPTNSPFAENSSKAELKRPLEITILGPETIKADDVVTYILDVGGTETLLDEVVDQVELQVFEIYYNAEDAGGSYTVEKLYSPRNFEILDPVKLSKDTFTSRDSDEIQFRVRWKRTVKDLTIFILAKGRVTMEDGTMSPEKEGIGQTALYINRSADFGK